MIREKETQALQTPMMRQYFSMKEKHPREILFFRMGDFYEMFFDDAKDASDILGLTLTSRSKDKDAIPMAGIPVRAVDSYVPKLLAAGRRVAICEQVQDPRDAKGILERKVVRVISPGTITDERLIGEKRNNFIASVVHGSGAAGGYGLAWLDVTTGQFCVWEHEDPVAIAAQIARIEPAEVLLPESLEFQLEREPALAEALSDIVDTPYPDSMFDHATAYRSLIEQFGTRSLDGFGCEALKLATRAGGGLIRYVSESQESALVHVTKLTPFRHQRYVPIDRATRRALELTETYRGGDRAGTLLACFDHTATAPGARLLRHWLLAPLTDVAAILARQDAVAELFDDERRRVALFDDLKRVHDLERLSTRLSFGSASARDLVALRDTLGVLPELRRGLEGSGSEVLRELARHLEPLTEVADEIGETLVDEPPLAVREGGIVRDGRDTQLDELRKIANEGTQWIAKFQHGEIERTGIPSLKVGFNRVFGYYLEVTNTHKDKVPQEYLRKQTLKNCERFITVELKEYETKVLNAKDNAVDLEYEIFCGLRDRVAEHIPVLQGIARAVAEIDVIATFARLAHERGYVRPVIDDSERLVIEDGRHPVVESVPTTEGFVPNSVELGSDSNIMIITGPNMAGKSTYIRQVAILTLLAQTGSFIPATSATIGVVDRIFTRVGAADDLTRGQSTFMVEMTETANILNNAGPRSLIILDEVGRGTSTFDGVSLAWAITEYIAENLGCRTLFATHYHELTALPAVQARARNYKFAVKEWNDEIVFLRKVVEGGADKSYGIHVARLAGVPRKALDRAREILSNLESQAFDLKDQPKLAKRSEPIRKTDVGTLQLDFFRDGNAELLEEIKRLDLDRTTPLEALDVLRDLQKRIV